MSNDLRLLQFSDPHLSARADAVLRGVATRPALEAVLRHARAQHTHVDALLLTGDLVNDDAAGYAGIRELFGAFGKPVLCLPGNHDEPEAMKRELPAPLFQVGGHTDMGAWRIVMLDTCVPGKAHGRLSGTELQRLAAALDSAGNRHVLIGLHHHPVRQGSRWLDSVYLQNADEFLAVTDRSSAVRAMVWGHVHQQFDSRRKGVRLLSVPSTCAQFLPHADQFALDPSPPGYRRLTLCEDGSIDTEVIRVPLQVGQALNQRAAGS